MPAERFPFKIAGIRAKDGKFIRFGAEEKKESGKTFYLLTVENLKQEKGRYSDIIYLEPDNKSFPTIQVYVSGYIMEKEAEQ